MNKNMRKFLAAILSCLILAGCAPQQDAEGEAIKGPEPAAPQKTEIPEAPAAPEEPKAAEESILEEMTLEEKVGQMFLSRCPETAAAEKCAEYQLGGYVLFSRDFKDRTPDEVRAEIDRYQLASKIPMFLAVDEEGGTVTRISRFPQFRERAFPSPRELYNDGGLVAVREDTDEKCDLLAGLGINMLLAPVCDVSTRKEDYMYPRALGRGAEETAEFVKTVVTAAREANIASVLKHFPGYGSNADTHTGIAVDSRPYEIFESSDFLPFLAGISAGAGTVLVSHNIVECMDAERPASLSPEVHLTLREELGFDGVIMTDDLYMDAIKMYTGAEEAAVMAVLAGNDLICCTDFEVQIPAVIAAVQEGKISEARIDESVLRILRLKLSLGIIEE